MKKTEANVATEIAKTPVNPTASIITKKNTAQVVVVVEATATAMEKKSDVQKTEQSPVKVAMAEAEHLVVGKKRRDTNPSPTKKKRVRFKDDAEGTESKKEQRLLGCLHPAWTVQLLREKMNSSYIQQLVEIFDTNVLDPRDPLVYHYLVLGNGLLPDLRTECRLTRTDFEARHPGLEFEIAWIAARMPYTDPRIVSQFVQLHDQFLDTHPGSEYATVNFIASLPKALSELEWLDIYDTQTRFLEYIGLI